MRWGTGEAAARERIPRLSLNELNSMGMTLEMAIAWARFYRIEAERNPSNGSAIGRAALMEHAAHLLRGGG
jgi:hypothetical protein